MKHLLVTHHAPDMDAIGAVWMFKRFETQHFADAAVAFVDPGQQISPSEAERLGFQMHQVVHVDTGMGEFDHHQPERGHLRICATSLVYDHVCAIHPELKNDKALKALVEQVIEDDHFGEVHWPEPQSLRYSFMLSELLRGFESVDPHDDDSQMTFGLKCMDCAYVSLRDSIQAQETLATGTEFETQHGKCLGIESKNDKVMKYAQKVGFMLVIRKDPGTGEVRIKARPDSNFELLALAEKIKQKDTVGTWFYHPSGKMLLNGSRKQRNQRPTNLSLEQVIEMVKETYGK